MRLTLLFLALLFCVLHNGRAFAQEVHNEFEQGTLTKGKPTGVWRYFDNGELGLVINYDSGTVRYQRPDTMRYQVWLDSTWQAKRLSRAPRLLGSRSMLVRTLQTNLRYPGIAIRDAQRGYVVVSCVVLENGQVSDPFVELQPASALGQEVLRVVNDLPLRFLPGVYRGRRVRTKVSFVVGFCISHGNDAKSVKSCFPSVPKVYGAFNEVIVTALGVPR